MTKHFRLIIMWILLTFGIGLLIFIQVVDHNGLTNWQDPITLIVWVYLIFIFIYIMFLHVTPMVWNYFRKK